MRVATKNNDALVALPSFKGRLVARDPTRVAAVAAFVRETLASAEEDGTFRYIEVGLES